MDIRPDAHAGDAGCCGSRTEQVPGTLQVGRGGDLESPLGASDVPHGMTRRSEQRRIVGVLGATVACRDVRGLEQRPREPLRRLRRGEFGTVDGGDDDTVHDLLEGVDDGQRRDHADICRHRRGDRIDLRRRGERARRIVHQHRLDVTPERGETRRDRLLSGRTAHDHTPEVGPFAGGLSKL